MGKAGAEGGTENQEGMEGKENENPKLFGGISHAVRIVDPQKGM